MDKPDNDLERKVLLRMPDERSRLSKVTMNCLRFAASGPGKV